MNFRHPLSREPATQDGERIKGAHTLTKGKLTLTAETRAGFALGEVTVISSGPAPSLPVPAPAPAKGLAAELLQGESTTLIGTSADSTPTAVYSTDKSVDAYADDLNTAGYEANQAEQDGEPVKDTFTVTRDGRTVTLQQVTMFTVGTLLVAVEVEDS
ncbi:hypothetical protein [Streptomyces sp. NPDC047108]|uniref:hypothetical protein n=1 Tax=Streptomyces sp. NPDC047108 TaxID=3155025 RepID=UPI0033C929CE